MFLRMGLLCAVVGYSYLLSAALSREELIRAWAPRVYLHPDEQYRPISVSDELQHCELRERLNDIDTEGKVVVPLGQVTVDTLREYSDQKYFLRHMDKKVFAGGACPENKCHAPIYADFVQYPDGSVIISYHHHYAFNGVMGGFDELSKALKMIGVGSGEHYGDWEFISVYLNPAQELTKIYYAAHGVNRYGVIVPAKDVLFELGHPVVFAAKGTHASFPKEFAGINSSYDRVGRGIQWDTWHNVIDMNTQPWRDFKGKWGALKGVSGPSPRTPKWLTAATQVDRSRWIDGVYKKSKPVNWSEKILTRSEHGTWRAYRGSRDGQEVNVCFNLYRVRIKPMNDALIYENVCTGQSRGVKRLRDTIYISDIRPEQSEPLFFKLDLEV